MCGRFTITMTMETFLSYLNTYEKMEINLKDFTLPQYNIAPTEQIVAMIYANDTYRVGSISWGYIPSFSKGNPLRLINARSETILTTRAFKDNFLTKRCVIFADGFYEWKEINGKKMPFRIIIKDQPIFAFAGLWNDNRNQGEIPFSATILTTTANTVVQTVHERMPVILTKEDVEIWLDPTKTTEELLPLLKPYPDEKTETYPVSNYVNSAKNKGQQCILPL